MHGPTVLDAEDRRRHKTYLIALLDDATRARAVRGLHAQRNRRRLPARLRAGDPAPRRSQAALRRQRQRLSLPPPRARLRQARRDPHPRPTVPPQGKGKMERWFRTVRTPAPADADSRPTRTHLDALNRRLWAWIEDEYHSTRRTAACRTPRPVDRWGPRPPSTSRSRRSDLDRALSLRGETQGPAGPHRQSPRRRLRGRCRARRPDRHAALRPRAADRAASPSSSRAAPIEHRHAASMPTPIASSAATTAPSSSPPARPARHPPGLPLRKLDEDF